MGNPEIYECEIEKSLRIIGGKWSFLVIRELFFHGTKRFTELKSAIHGISSKSLTETLRHLEENQVVIRSIHATVPPTVEYRLTAKGEAFSGILLEMKKWVRDWA
ncbi:MULTISPECIES: winged helix-turn-helix transcriptional regulator [Paenibacillus]|uniref:HTH-type transcriptional activator HxlR n=1 Tax=Paenibacillus glycanilyticus TaxID=126569 RepID=A0ABQ6NQB5_9BACL|nr:helix-turn-helix domain-containing protein [Paenibacillus glycanilyticus]GMK46974.1 HTH-type transcriptional activator HxlR [Paenibacillus glycanilyticus]